jgi:hypothetical protein
VSTVRVSLQDVPEQQSCRSEIDRYLRVPAPVNGVNGGQRKVLHMALCNVTFLPYNQVWQLANGAIVRVSISLIKLALTHKLKRHFQPRTAAPVANIIACMRVAGVGNGCVPVSTCALRALINARPAVCAV